MDRSDHDSDDMSKPEPQTAPLEGQGRVKPDLKAERAQRLAAALRQNLKRRKAPQAKVRPVDERN